MGLLLEEMTPEDVRALSERQRLLVRKVRESPYIPGEPTAPQWAFLLDERREVMYGGSAGPGKSWALLATALLHVDDPSYRALILRRTFADLRKDGALMDMADQWLIGTPAKRKQDGVSWHFPSGARLSFGYLAAENHKYNYQSAAYTFVGFDELTQFTSSQYRYLFSRVRRAKGKAGRGQRTPLRVRSASNPGGLGHEWVKQRFVDPMSPGTARNRLFVPALAIDNPHLDLDEYREMLAELDPVTRRQLEHGDWEVRPAGNFFLPLIRVVSDYETDSDWSHPGVIRCRAWDLAASETGDWAVGCRVARHPLTRRWRIEDVVRVRAEPAQLDTVLRSTARADGPHVMQVIEQEGGSAGKIAMRQIRTDVMVNSPVTPEKPTGNKLTRARLAASVVAAGDVEINPGPYVGQFLDELGAFPEVEHDDQVDSFAHAVNWIARQVSGGPPTAPKGTKEQLAAKPKTLAQTKVRIVR
jgi:predicted phage terminase large subunit-like protein